MAEAPLIVREYLAELINRVAGRMMPDAVCELAQLAQLVQFHSGLGVLAEGLKAALDLERCFVRLETARGAQGWLHEVLYSYWDQPVEDGLKAVVNVAGLIEEDPRFAGEVDALSGAAEVGGMLARAGAMLAK